MEKTPRQPRLSKAPDNWREEVSRIIGTWENKSYREGAARILKHHDTEAALLHLLQAAKKSRKNIGPNELSFILNACVCEATPSPGYSFRDKRKARKLLAAIDVLAEHTDMHFILDPRKEGFFPFGERALLPGIEDARKFLASFAYPPAHRPTDFPQVVLALRLGMMFKKMFGSERRPAIDGFLSATFGPHREVSKILKTAHTRL